MKCDQDKCDADVAFRYTWPGRPESGICAAHAPKLRAVARAIGLELELHAVDARILALVTETTLVDAAAAFELEDGAEVTLSAFAARGLAAQRAVDDAGAAVAKLGEAIERAKQTPGCSCPMVPKVDGRSRHMEHCVVSRAQHAHDRLLELARRLRTLATFNSSGSGVEAIDDAKERRAFRLALYEIADQMEELELEIFAVSL